MVVVPWWFCPRVIWLQADGGPIVHNKVNVFHYTIYLCSNFVVI